MPGVTNPAEEYFKDGLWAWDPAGTKWLKLIIDPLTNRLVIDHPGDLEVVQPVPNDLRVGNYGWDGAAWRKLSLVWGYSGQYMERINGQDVAAGASSVAGSQVPEGEVWVVTALTIVPAQANATKMYFAVYDGAVNHELLQREAVVVDRAYTWSGQVVMVKDDRLVLGWAGALAGDDFWGSAFGYKMKIAE